MVLEKMTAARWLKQATEELIRIGLGHPPHRQYSEKLGHGIYEYRDSDIDSSLALYEFGLSHGASGSTLEVLYSDIDEVNLPSLRSLMQKVAESSARITIRLEIDLETVRIPLATPVFSAIATALHRVVAERL